MKVVLFNGPYNTYRVCEEHLGIESIGAYLMHNNINVSIVDAPAEGLNYELSKEILLKECRDADILGVSLLINHKDTLSIAFLIKQTFPNIHITIGGFMATFWHHEILFEYPWLDSAVVGEGELPMLRLSHVLHANGKLGSVPGLAYVSDDKLHSNPLPSLPEIDSLPDVLRPNTKKLIDNLVPVSITASRGCYGKCTFCSINTFYNLCGGPKWRPKSPIRIAAEIKNIAISTGASAFKIVDDNFLAGGEEFVRDFINEIKTYKLKIRLKLFGRANDVIRLKHLLPQLKEIGVEMISIGIENVVERTLKLFNKNIDISENYKCLKIMQDSGILTSCLMIILEPFTTLEEVGENIKFLRETFFTITNPLYNKVFIHQGDPLYYLLKEKGMLRREGYDWYYDFVDPVTQEFDQALIIWSKSYNKYHHLLLEYIWSEYLPSQNVKNEILIAFFNLKEIEFKLFENLIKLSGSYSKGILISEVERYIKEYEDIIIKIYENTRRLVEQEISLFKLKKSV